MLHAVGLLHVTAACSLPIIQLDIVVGDVNDNPPLCLHQPLVLLLDRQAAPGKVVGTVEASDADQGENASVTYTLSHQFFAVNETSGELYTTGSVSTSVA